MTGIQKQKIQELRQQGLAFSHIADSLGLSINTIKSFYRRNNSIACDASNATENYENKEQCKKCGKKLNQIPKSKHKTFCSDKCRFDWWNNHRSNPDHQATCVHCGTYFNTRGNKNRKYCSHRCYITMRYRGDGCVRQAI